MGFRTCPACGALVGDLRSGCDCGFVFPELPATAKPIRRPPASGLRQGLGAAAACFAAGSLVCMGMLFQPEGSRSLLLYALLCSVVALVLGVVVIFSNRKAEVPWTATLAVVVGGGFTALGALVVLAASMMGAPGRPVRVAGIPWLPRVRRARGGRDDAPLVRMPSSQTRSVLAKLWIADARAEHASIAAFERLATELDLLGAPAALIRWAKRAAREEDGHARACLELAAAYGGVALDVVPSRAALSSPRFTRPGSSARRRELLARMAVESLLEGSVGEGLAAKVAREGSLCAREAALASILDQVAREEESHASLARAILAWCVGEDPSSAAVLRWALGRSRRRRAAVVTCDDLRAFGRLDSARVAELAHTAHEEAERHLQSIRAASQSPEIGAAGLGSRPSSKSANGEPAQRAGAPR